MPTDLLRLRPPQQLQPPLLQHPPQQRMSVKLPPL
jgi:hypothetical protein